MWWSDIKSGLFTYLWIKSFNIDFYLFLLAYNVRKTSFEEPRVQ